MEIHKVASPQDWVYFAKGAANILFEYKGTNDFLKNKLLRLRMNNKDEKEYILTCSLFDFVELKCKQLFELLEITDMQLVVLTPEFLRQLDTNGTELKESEKYGFLIPNNVPSDFIKLKGTKNFCLFYNESSVIAEIKPKWLYDNYNTNYCRSCLLVQLRQGLNSKRHFCPLDLLYPQTINRVVDDMFGIFSEEDLARLYDKTKIDIKQLFALYLKDSDNIFQKLKHFQAAKDSSTYLRNVSDAEHVPDDLLLMMTLRDVGLFLKFDKSQQKRPETDLEPLLSSSNDLVNTLLQTSTQWKSQTSINTTGLKVLNYKGDEYYVNCNIYDLDLKSRHKLAHWKKTEQSLQQIYYSSNPNWRYCIKLDGGGDKENPY
ncbi:Inositol-pentakisphosphate 2-kinase [Scheffersomyces spartinae]|uniref:Inositol-pentakisphosphate 2-kinase n=1 Tax=Scheffersomyces spartinae TaxID=45513 RepID=A0A9P7VDR1_9ASCO|nr:Inositol-pentakisphosphate 2-kinase [Scheffersomyces spartinae]KAG7195907.1 Inositol-pentakisphosphate 2-kinase [Scheffersomyces spartinae]